MEKTAIDSAWFDFQLPHKAVNVFMVFAYLEEDFVRRIAALGRYEILASCGEKIELYGPYWPHATKFIKRWHRIKEAAKPLPQPIWEELCEYL
jgi:hypothetical protein